MQSLKETPVYTTTHLGDVDYPKQLAALVDPPDPIWYQGDLFPNHPKVAVVGSRNCGDTAAMVVKDLVSLLQQRNGIIVSGLAKGVDALAHKAAVETNAHTIAVLPCGIDVCYPPENTSLWRCIVDSGGGVVSIFHPGTQPERSRFLARNRIIAGLSQAGIVVEAGEYSGTRNFVTHCLKQNKPLGLLWGVVESTRWGAALKGHPNVTVLRDIGDAQVFIEQVCTVE